MNTHFEALLDRTIQLAQGFVGEIVAGSLEKTKASLLRNVVSVMVGASALVLALIFGAVGLNRWLETIIDANHRWASPVIVALVCGMVGFAVIHSGRGRRAS